MTLTLILQVPSLRLRQPELQEDGRPQHGRAPEGFQGGQEGVWEGAPIKKNFKVLATQEVQV